MPRYAGIDPTVPPSGTGCADCLAGDGPGWWFHLRRCAQCGHVGCCDASPSQHATHHHEKSGHPVVQSFEPGEDWFWSYARRKMILVSEALAPPTHRPLDQPAPGPRGKVPADWKSRLNDG
jgi:hypothetical protein